MESKSSSPAGYLIGLPLVDQFFEEFHPPIVPARG